MLLNGLSDQYLMFKETLLYTLLTHFFCGQIVGDLTTNLFTIQREL